MNFLDNIEPVIGIVIGGVITFVVIEMLVPSCLYEDDTLRYQLKKYWKRKVAIYILKKYINQLTNMLKKEKNTDIVISNARLLYKVRRLKRKWDSREEHKPVRKRQIKLLQALMNKKFISNLK